MEWRWSCLLTGEKSQQDKCTEYYSYRTGQDSTHDATQRPPHDTLIWSALVCFLGTSYGVTSTYMLLQPVSHASRIHTTSLVGLDSPHSPNKPATLHISCYCDDYMYLLLRVRLHYVLLLAVAAQLKGHLRSGKGPCLSGAYPSPHKHASLGTYWRLVKVI